MIPFMQPKTAGGMSFERRLMIRGLKNIPSVGIALGVFYFVVNLAIALWVLSSHWGMHFPLFPRNIPSIWQSFCDTGFLVGWASDIYGTKLYGYVWFVLNAISSLLASKWIGQSSGRFRDAKFLLSSLLFFASFYVVSTFVLTTALSLSSDDLHQRMRETLHDNLADLQGEEVSALDLGRARGLLLAWPSNHEDEEGLLSADYLIGSLLLDRIGPAFPCPEGPDPVRVRAAVMRSLPRQAQRAIAFELLQAPSPPTSAVGPRIENRQFFSSTYLLNFAVGLLEAEANVEAEWVLSGMLESAERRAVVPIHCPTDSACRCPYFYRGVARYRNGDDFGGLADLERAEDLVPNDPLTANLLAWLLAVSLPPHARDLDRAYVLAERAVQLTNSGDPHSYDTLAAVQAGQGNFTRALDTQNLAISIASREAVLSGDRNFLERRVPEERVERLLWYSNQRPAMDRRSRGWRRGAER